MAEPIKIEKSLSETKGELKKGQHLGKYRLKEHLGTGGSCEVWKARDTAEGIWVALKIPVVDINGQRDKKNILREIQHVAQVRHRNILAVKNADIINGYPVLATELSTKTLDDCSKPMSTRRVISIMSQILEGLAYAHKHRLVHCDVTPGNIFLFPDGRAALGDFGISLKVEGRMTTVDEFGTPGYVAPEQAYGKPTYRSDCFAAALITYEYITAVLPRWPFQWPLPGSNHLRQKTTAKFVTFIRKSLSVDPKGRFANASEMANAFIEAVPKKLKNAVHEKTTYKRQKNWRKIRTESFIRKYKKLFGSFHKCRDCGEPITESMLICPWCGSEKNHFDRRSHFKYICPRCHKGLSEQWRFCPWCYGYGFEMPHPDKPSPIRYHSRCKYCNGKIMRFMRYCPWCRRKITKSRQVRPFPEVCSKCGWSVDTEYWNYCPWCKQSLI